MMIGDTGDEAFFINQNYNNYVAKIMLPTKEYIVNYKFGETSVKKQTSITAEKIDFKGLVQIRLAEKDDQTKMFISTIDTNYFTEIKKEQSLHVTFTGFIDNLVKIFNECQLGKLQINLIREKGKENSFLIQFYEIRSFRNLIHLCLPIKEAPLPIVLFYINQTVKILQKQNDSYSMNLEHSQKEIEKNVMLITQLQKENEKLKSDLNEQENLKIIKNQEEIFRLQENIQKLNTDYNSEEKRLKQIISNLQNEIERYRIENTQLNQEKMKQIKKLEYLNEEICVLKSNNANLKEQNEKLHTDNATIRNIERKNEVHMNELKKQIQEMKENAKKYEKIKSELLAKIEAEKILCHSKRNALDLATEEISKADKIISKQKEEITKLKKSVDWRTEVALQQEKIIKEKEKKIQKQNEQLINLQSEIKEMRNESEKFFQHLNSIKDLTNKIETKYNEKIQEFNKKLTS